MNDEQEKAINQSMMMMSGLKQVLIFGVGFMLALGLNHFNTKNTNLASPYLPPQQKSHINTINNTTNQQPTDDDEPINAIRARPVGFDYFLFVLQWPDAFCNLQRNRPRKCNPDPPLPKHQDKFTVHGLWPQLNNGESAIFCTTTDAMTPNDLAAVQNDLLDYWPNLFNAQQWPPPPAANNFWIKQWEKHGKCSSGMYNARQYLDITIDLAKMYAEPILDELHSQGIDPDGITPHKASRIREAVRRVTNREPMLSIQVNDSDEQLLLEIRLCIRRDGVTTFDCDPFYRFARP